MGRTQRRALIEGLIARRGVRSIQWAIDPAHPGPGGSASMGGNYPRMIMGLRGRRQVRIVRDGQPVSFVLAAGDCLVLAPHCWVATDGAGSFLTAGVALEERNPRLVLTEGRRMRPDRGAEAVRPLLEVLPGLCDRVTVWLTAALLEARGSDALDLYARRLVEGLWLRIARHAPTADGIGPTKADVTYGAVEHYVHEHFARPIERDDVASHLRIHPSHVTRLCRKFAGEPFGALLLRVRLESARSLLRDARLTISEVGYLCGFTSPNYFVRSYRKRYGTTPGRDRTVVI